MDGSCTLVVGGTGTLGASFARRRAAAGFRVALTSRSAERASAFAAELGSGTVGLALDLSRAETIEPSLAGLGAIDAVVITAVEQSTTSLREFDLDRVQRGVAMKLVGYTEVVRVLLDRMTPEAAVVLFGGLAKDQPYPGSTVVTAFNGGVATLVNTLAVEIAPHRVNAIHPGVVGDTPRWVNVDHPAKSRTPIGRLVTSDEITDGVEFLLRNGGINAQNLCIDGGVRLG